MTKPRGGQASLSEFRNNRVAVFEFFANGRPVKVSDPADTYPCPYRMDQKVRICYDPENPEHFEVESVNIKSRIADAIRMLGIVFAIAGCILSSCMQQEWKSEDRQIERIRKEIRSYFVS